jgi:xanthine dehydrogenase molybdenum-binding subunit
MADETNSSVPPAYRVIGTRPIRHDGIDKVTGRAKYGADYAFPRMIHGKVLRSPHAHARINSISIEKALGLPGVFAIITGADLPDVASKTEDLGEGAVNTRYVSMNVLARDRVLYDGHAVAAVAAVNGHVADEALKLIEVDYEVLPSAMTVDAAMKSDAPIILPELRNKEDGPTKQTNVANHLKFTRGNLSEGFAAANFIVEREFNTAMVHQGYIEPHNAVGMYPRDSVLLHSRHFCGTLADRASPPDAGGQHKSRSGGNRRRFRGQAGSLSGAAGGVAFEKNRQTRENGHDTRGGATRQRTDLGIEDPLQDGCDA